MALEQRVLSNLNTEIGSLNGEPILPPSLRAEITADQLRTTYPLRYQAYSRAHGNETNGKENRIHTDVLTRRLRMVNNLDRYITSHETSEHRRVLKEKQLVVFKDIKDTLEKGNTEGYVEAPTGFGKTVLFSQIVKATDQRTLIAVPSRILVEQTYERLKQFNPDLDVGRFYTDKKEQGRKVTITTYNSLIMLNGGTNPQDIDLLILDEAHKSLTGPRVDAVGKFSNAVKLGFTATPEYSQDKRVEKLLNNEIHNITLKEAVETGLLSSFSVYLAETDVDLSKVSITNNGDYDQKELEKAINIQSRNKSAVELYQKLVDKNPDLSKSVVNCVSVKHAKEVAHLFQEAGIKTETIHSNQDQEERNNIIKRYKEGQLQVLTNVNILTEGFDDPQAALAINLRPTLSKVVAKQRGGRILRLDPENPSKHAVIVDYLDKNEKKRNLQITFAQVAHGVKIINPAESNITQQEEKSRQEKKPKQPLIIDGLNVITNTEEVLKIVKGLELQIEKTMTVTETDFVISTDSLRNTFIGGSEKLKQTVSEVLEELKKKIPDIIQKKLNKNVRNTWVNVVTDRNLFIQNMLDKGTELKQPSDNIQPEDFSTTASSILSMFEGSHGNVVTIAREIIEGLKISKPDIFVIRKTKTRYIPVMTDTKPFIEAMLEKGMKLKISQSLTIGDSGIAITQKELRGVILLKKNYKAAADQAVEEIRAENPKMVNQRKSGFNTVTVVTDRNIFLKKMKERGFGLRDKTSQPIQPTDFSTDYKDLTSFFIGHRNALVKTAREIVNTLSNETPELIAKRRREKGKPVDVVTDRELFIELMQEKGFKIRQNTLIDIFP